MPRFAAIAFEGLALEIAFQRLASESSLPAKVEGTACEDAPIAVVVCRPGGSVQGETSLLGNTRLDEISTEARAFGLRPGQTIASAKAKLSSLRVRVVEQAAVHAVLVTIAEMALLFGTTTSFEAGGLAGDIVWIDVTGCAHLHGHERDPQGELTLGEKIARAVYALGHACRVALADGVKVAAAVARFAMTPFLSTRPKMARGARVLEKEAFCPLVVPIHGNARAMGRLPLRALGLSVEAVGWLSKVGVRKVSDLQRLPRSALAARLGQEAARVMALLDGDDRTPLCPHIPPEKPLERVVLEYGITHHEALFFVIKRLCDRLAVRLEGRVRKAAKLLLRLEVDHAVAGAPPRDPTLPLTLASSLSKAEELFAVVKAKVESPDGAARMAIEHEDNGVLDVPILAVSLEVTEEVAAEVVAQSLFVPEAKAERALPRLVAELSSALGPTVVGVLALVDTWVIDDRSRLVPYKASAPSRGGPPLVSEGDEMSRLLPVPKAVSRSALRNARLVARSAYVEWWKPGATANDAFVVFLEDNGSAGVKGGSPRNATSEATSGHGTAWVSVDGRTGDAIIRGWLD